MGAMVCWACVKYIFRIQDMLFLNSTYVFMMCKIILQQQIMTFSTDTRTGTLTKPKTETITKQKYPKFTTTQCFCSLSVKTMWKRAK